MSELSGTAPTPGSYLDRDRARTAELHRLVAELEFLRGDRRNNLGHIRSIGLRLRTLADEQRTDMVPRSDERLHVSLWRKIDIQARRAELILMSDSPPLDALDADYAEVGSRSPVVTPYDVALMHLSGEPIPAWSAPPPPQREVSAREWVGRITGLALLATPVFLLARAGHPLTGVLIVATAIITITPLREWFEGIFGDPLPPQPPYRVEITVPDIVLFDEILGQTIAQLSVSVERTDREEATGADFDLSIAELRKHMETLERIRVPSAAEQVHAAGLAVVSGWLGVLQTARSGAPVRQAVREVDELTERANQELERYRSANFSPSAPSE